jgi:Putative beta-barrel porin-2, OmpL-like. bbp2
MKINIIISCLFLFILKNGMSQTDSSKVASSFVLNGHVDAYWRTAFNSSKASINNFTSFTNSNQQLQLGMVTGKLDYTKGQFFATLDLGFGKRAEAFSYNDKGLLSTIKQAYIAFNLSDRLKLSTGKWATHIGYELLDAPLNRNYSMSYGFSYGPFFHTGLKADFAINSSSGIMIGLGNPTDNLNAIGPYKVLIGQYSKKLWEDKTVLYVNYQGGKTSENGRYNQWDFVVTNAVSDQITINYDGTIFMTKLAGKKSNWKSNALYVNYDPSEKIGLTFRSECFFDKHAISAGAFATEIFANTLSLNYKIKKITLLPELRIESAKDPIYVNKEGNPTNKSASYVLAAIYKF